MSSDIKNLENESNNNLENESNNLGDIKKNKMDRKRVILVACCVSFTFILLSVGLFFTFKALLKHVNLKDNSFSIVSVVKNTDGNYISTDEVFTVKTKNGSLEDVQKHLYIEPAVNYDIKKKNNNTYEVVTKDIPSDSILNVKYVDNKVVEDNWAFQSDKTLKVSSIFPANESSNISTTSVIEVMLSYPDVENFKESVEISPSVSGEFVQNGRVWILRPTQPLQSDTVYTITIKDTLKRGDEKLEESVKSTFSTYVSNNTNYTTLNYDSITVDNIATFTPNDNFMFRTKGDITKVEILKFKSSNDFKKYIDNNNDYKTDSLGEVPFEKIDDNLYRVNKTFDEGYYLEKAYLDSGELYFTIPVQVNKLSAYLVSTQNDILVWVGNEGKLLKDISVVYNDDNTVKTNDDGIAIIKKYNDTKESIKYVKVGEDNPIFIGVKNINSEQIPNGYIYVDRPLYKNTDKVSIWGYIPLKYFEEEPSLNDFVLSIDDKNIPINVLEDGTFITSYDLDNEKDGYRYLKLNYKNVTIASRSFEVKQYEKEMYIFNININNNYVKAGDKFKFSVNVKHISGLSVPNKEIQVIYGDQVLKGITDTLGNADFEVDTSLNNNNNNLIVDNKSITVKSTLTESIQKGYTFNFFIINRYLGFRNSSYDKKKKEYTLDIYNLSDSKNVTKIDWGYDQLLDSNYNGKVNIVLNERSNVRTISGSRYNAITKQNEPTYDYNSYITPVENKSIDVKDGKLVYKFDYDFKKSTDDVSYSYEAYITLNDKNGVLTAYNGYLGFVSDENDYNKNGYYDSTTYSSSNYDMYDYYLPKGNGKYSVNDSFNRDLMHYLTGKESEKNNFLLIEYKNSILNNKLINDTTKISSTFKDEYRPGFKITGAYYKEGKFYRLPAEYLDYNEENSKLDVNIDTNKKSYSPGDEVEVSIGVNKNGKGIKSKINVSVVDEGIFASIDDETFILNNLYRDKYYSQYTFSTYRDYLLFNSGGGAGSSSAGGRSNFGDTLYFDSIETDKSGNAKIKFKLNDSITSFRITVHAVNDDVDAGVNHINIESTLPVSISYTEPRGLKATDDVVLNAIGIGSSNSDIKYTFSIEEIKKDVVVTSKIGKPAYASFGKLPVGEYNVVVSAVSGNSTDKVKYKIHVGNTQNEISVKNTSSIKDMKSITTVKNPIKLEFFRSSFKEYEKFLDIIKSTNEDRLDTKYSYSKALEYENNYIEDKNVIDIGDISKFKTDKGWKFLNGENTSYELTALLSYYDSSYRFNKDIYYEMLNSDKLTDRLNAYMVLASMKEPILDDLKTIKNVSDEDKDKLALAFLLIGDYDEVRKLSYTSDTGLSTYLSTFINKDEAFKKIDKLYKSDYANRYLYFSIISYFENNNVDLDSKEDLIVKYGKKEEKITLSSLGKKYLTVYQKDLKDLKFNSKYDDILINYYYEGSIDEIDNPTKNISTTIDNNKLKVGELTNYNIDISNIESGSIFKVYLPNGLRISSGFRSDCAYIDSSKVEYIIVYMGIKTDDSISIPLYASSPGEYVIEPIIINKEGHYQISNDIKVKITE